MTAIDAWLLFDADSHGNSPLKKQNSIQGLWDCENSLKGRKSQASSVIEMKLSST